MNRLASAVQCTLLFLIFVILLVHTLAFEKIPRPKNAGPTAKGFDSTIIGTNCEARGQVPCRPPATGLVKQPVQDRSIDWLPGIMKDLAKIIPDLEYRPFVTVRVDGKPLDVLPLDTKMEEINLIEIIDGSVTNVVYHRPPKLKKGNWPYGNSASR